MGAIELVEKAQLAERPAMKSGDTVRVHVKVREGDKERIQIFEGVVIGLHRGGTRASFTVRKVSFGQGVERIFPLHSPTIQKVEVMRSAKVRRAKLYYLRDLKGKAARMKDGAQEPDSAELSQQRSTAHGSRSGHAHARERAAARRVLPCGRRRRGRARLPGRSGRGGGRRAPSRPAHSRRLRLEAGAGRRARAAVRAHRRATPSPGRWRRPIRARSTTSTSIRRRCARCSARSSRSRRCRTSCSSTRSASRICRWRSAASCTATAAARRSPRRRSSPR